MVSYSRISQELAVSFPCRVSCLGAIAERAEGACRLPPDFFAAKDNLQQNDNELGRLSHVKSMPQHSICWPDQTLPLAPISRPL